MQTFKGSIVFKSEGSRTNMSMFESQACLIFVDFGHMKIELEHRYGVLKIAPGSQ